MTQEYTTAQYTYSPEVTGFEVLLVSVPPNNPTATQEVYVRVVEEAGYGDAVDYGRFFGALAVLDAYRAEGFLTPPYTAGVETRRTHGEIYRQAVLLVDHVDGLHFNEVDFTRPQAVRDYAEHGRRLIDYFRNCHVQNLPFLTDITKIDQSLYVQVSPSQYRLVMVDLEGHTSQGPMADQLLRFIDSFIVPLERASGTEQLQLRRELQAMLDAYQPADPEDAWTAEACKMMVHVPARLLLPLKGAI